MHERSRFREYLDRAQVTYYLVVGLILIVLLKVALLVFFNGYGYPVFGEGNDSNFYHHYAISNEIRDVPSIWPSILRFLNTVDLYSREFISYMLQFIGVLLIPLLAAKISLTNKRSGNVNASLLLALLLSFYPTLFYYTLDIWRDVFMVFCFLFGVFLVKEYIRKQGVFSIVLIWIMIILLGIFMYGLRPYLGFSFAAAFIGFGLIKMNSKYFFFLIIFYLLSLLVLYETGVLDPLLKYRGIFETVISGGTNLEHSFENGFILGLLKGWFQQLFGFYFGNLQSIFLFIMESVPFLFSIVYVVINRRFSTGLVNFLMLFFVIYASIFIIANANYGTGVRLRLFPYLSVYLSAFIIYQNKTLDLKNSLV